MALASVSKTFTAAEVMLLAERGKVDLDAAASTYLPLRQVANGVTIRQLLAHRSAIPDPGDKPYASLLTDLGADWSVQEFLAPVPAATAKPGQEYHYDNTNYVLLGLVIEKVTGRDVATTISTDLWKPLGLNRLAYQDQQRLPRRSPDRDRTTRSRTASPTSHICPSAHSPARWARRARSPATRFLRLGGGTSSTAATCSGRTRSRR